MRGECCLKIFGNELFYTRINTLLGMNATRTVDKGQKTAAGRIAPKYAWMYEVPIGQNRIFSDEVRVFLKKMLEKKKELQFLMSEYLVEFTCNLRPDDCQAGFTLESDIAGMLNELGFMIDFDILSFGNIDEDRLLIDFEEDRNIEGGALARRMHEMKIRLDMDEDRKLTFEELQNIAEGVERTSEGKYHKTEGECVLKIYADQEKHQQISSILGIKEACDAGKGSPEADGECVPMSFCTFSEEILQHEKLSDKIKSFCSVLLSKREELHMISLEHPMKLTCYLRSDNCQMHAELSSEVLGLLEESGICLHFDIVSYGLI